VNVDVDGNGDVDLSARSLTLTKMLRSAPPSFLVQAGTWVAFLTGHMGGTGFLGRQVKAG
jgi:hypothetical protein